MIQRTLRCFSLLLALALLAPSAASAAMFGVRVGEYTDVGEPFLGVEFLHQVYPDIWFNPNFEYVFVDDGNLMTLNFDFHYDFDIPNPTLVWVGGGPAIVFRDFDRPRDDDDSETDFGLNLLGGIGWQLDAVVPYLQAKAILSDENEFVVAFGLRF